MPPKPIKPLKQRRKDKALQQHKRRYTQLTADQKTERLHRIGEMILEGKKQSEIALELGITAQQCSIEVSRLRTLRAKQLTVIGEELRAESMAEINWVQRQAKLAWLDSRTARTKTDTLMEGLAGKGNEATKVKKITKKVMELIGVGDPAYLTTILNAEEKKIKLFGYALPPAAVVDKDGNAVANIILNINGSGIMPITDESDQTDD